MSAGPRRVLYVDIRATDPKAAAKGLRAVTNALAGADVQARLSIDLVADDIAGKKTTDLEFAKMVKGAVDSDLDKLAQVVAAQPPKAIGAKSTARATLLSRAENWLLAGGKIGAAVKAVGDIVTWIKLMLGQ